LLVTVTESRVEPLRRAWARQRIETHVIGAVEAGRGVHVTRRGRRVAFPWLARDEIITALERDAAHRRVARWRPRARGGP